MTTPAPIAAPAQTEAPASIESAHPVVVAPVIKKAAPKLLTPLEMTRDAVSTTFSGLNSPSLHDSGRLDVSSQVVKMLAALLVVLLLILGSVKLLRRFNLIPEATQDQLTNRPGQKAPAQLPLNRLSRALVSGMKKPDVASPTISVGAESFELLSSLSLPGSSAVIHLVRAAEKTLVLSTTPAGGVSILTEVTASAGVNRSDDKLPVGEAIDSAENDEDAVMAFAEILREQTGLPVRADLRMLDRVDARLSATQERLNSKLKAGAELSSAVLAVTPAPTRRRTPKTAQPKATEL